MNLFVQLGQFATQHDMPIAAKDFRQVINGLDDPVRRFVENERSRHSPKPLD